MEHSIKREELYEKVWTEPLKNIAPQLGVSDVAVAKACRKANIPLPGRGHWAKLRACKSTIKIPLPKRFPGSSNTITIGGHAGWNDSWRAELRDNPLPPPPSFEETLEDLRKRVTKIVGKVNYLTLSKQTHSIIKIFIDVDEKRLIDYRKNGHSWYEPYFNSPIEKRRLRILNAIFLAVQRLGCRPTMDTSSYHMKDNRQSSVTVGNESVYFTLETCTTKKSSRNQLNKMKDVLRLSILQSASGNTVRSSWEDTLDSKLEKNLDQIVNEILIIGEQQYRESVVARYEWNVKLKKELEEEAHQEILRKEHEARERQKRLEKARIDKLLNESIMLQQAETIRNYVAKIQSQSSKIKVPKEKIDQWAKWALEQADRIDPLISLSFLLEP